MIEQHTKEEILASLSKASFATVATFDGGHLRTRSMHFGNDEDLNFYFASMKADPKIAQMELNPAVSLLINERAPDEVDTAEIEVTGRGSVVRDDQERQELLKFLTTKSPVVKNLYEAGMTDLLAVIRIRPQTLRYRIFREIVRGVPPTVLEFEAAEKAVGHEYGGWTTTTEKLKRWALEVRIPFLTAAGVPLILGAAIAWAMTGAFDAGLFFLTLVGGLCLQAGTNVANDYFDHRSNCDDINTEYVRPFSGGSRMIQKGLLSAREVFIEALVLFAVGSLIGLYLAWVRGPAILILGVIGVFSGFFYTAPPIKLANRGVGELFVGLNFGVLMTLGAYWVQTGSFAWQPVVAAIPVSLLIAAVLYLNQFPDYAADKAVGKNHLVVRLGKERAVAWYGPLMVAPYVVVVAGVLARLVPGTSNFSLPWFSLAALLVLPKALSAIRTAQVNYATSIYLIPANANTIMAHLQTGLLLAGAFVLDGAWRVFAGGLF